jgi:CHAT domain
MKIALFEVCRRPEVLKQSTEAIVLTECFTNLGIEFELYTNDGYWADRSKAGSTLNREIIRKCLGDQNVDIVHFAVHGGPTGLALKWSGPINNRVAVDVLTGSEIRGMKEFRDRLIVSGACGSAELAKDFLAVGATAFVAPDLEIPWKNLGMLFHSFYESLKSGSTVEASLASAVSGHPDLASYRVYS